MKYMDNLIYVLTEELDNRDGTVRYVKVLDDATLIRVSVMKMPHISCTGWILRWDKNTILISNNSAVYRRNIRGMRDLIYDQNSVLIDNNTILAFCIYAVFLMKLMCANGGCVNNNRKMTKLIIVFCIHTKIVSMQKCRNHIK